MPNRWAVANGNWSDAATWSGSLIPTSADDVFANNRTVNVDTSFQVLTLRNSASASAITAGGTFNFNSGGISGSATAATLLFFGAANLITATATTGSVTLTLGGSVNAGALGWNSSTGITHSGNCDFSLIGVAGTSITSSGSPFISKTSTSTLTIVANLRGFAEILNSTAGTVIITGSVQAAVSSGILTGIRLTGGSITINGNVTAGPSANAAGRGIDYSSTTTPPSSFILINGNVIGGVETIGGQAAPGVNTVVPITVNGNVFAGSNNAGITSTANVTVNGNVFGSGSAPAGISSTAAIVVTVSGSVIAGATGSAITLTNSNSQVYLTGNMINIGSRTAIYAPNVWINKDVPSSAQFFTSGGADRTLYTEDIFPNLPSGSNVRRGTTYGPELGRVGTLSMPSPTDVASGTTFDTGSVGTALLTASVLLTQISASTDNTAVRMKNILTEEVAGAIISQYKQV